MEQSQNHSELIIFSELSQKDKVKYFNLFLDNDIEFTREDSGTYLAEIQVIKEEEMQLQLDKSILQTKLNAKKDYEVTYARVLSVIHPLIGIKGKKMNICLLKFLIEEMYSLRFVKDTQSIAKQTDAPSEPFPYFVGEFFLNKYEKKTVLDQQCIDFLLSLEFYSRTNKEIGLFAKFLSEEYDVDDLIFFLFVRSCIEKEMKMFFIEKAKEDLQYVHLDVPYTEIYIPVKLCKKIAQSIFGSDEKDLLMAFIQKTEELANNNNNSPKKNSVKANSVLLFSLEDYHKSRVINQQVSAFGNDDPNLSTITYNNNNNHNLNNMNNNNNNNNNYATINNTSMTKREMNMTHAGDISKNGETMPTTNRACNGVELKKIIKETKSEKCQTDSEKKAGIKKILNSYIKQKEIDNYFKNLLNSNPIFDGINESMSSAIESVKEITLKKITVMINLIVGQEKSGFLSFLKVKPTDSKANKKYQQLLTQLTKLLKVKLLIDINESELQDFINNLLNIPEMNIQISKLLLKTIE